MTYRLTALFFMLVFYGIYFCKMLIQRKKGIVTNQMARGRERDRSYYTELVMKVATYLVPIAEVISIIAGIAMLPLMFRVIGMHCAFIGNIIFFMAVFTMRDSWRAGVAKDDKDQRNLVTSGIYQFSRNPAFLGFDLVYIGILLMFFNPVLCIISLFAMVMLHLQILQEEKYLEKTYSEEYRQYRKKAGRYLGYGVRSFTGILMLVYFVLGVWALLYYATCLMYGGGFGLSWVWLWLIVAAFSFVRVIMLKARIDGREKKKLPRAFRYIYRTLFVIALSFFVITEAKIIGAMKARPRQNLEYIIVLGAGIRDTEPSNPYRVRIERAGEYLTANPDTMAVLSGGQGFDEKISEAECAKRKLIKDYGIDESRLIMEENSRDTEQNLKYSLELIGDPKASVGIVTNGFHELRAMSIARNVGYENVSSVPATTLFPVGVHYTVREFFGMVEFYIKYGGL